MATKSKSKPKRVTFISPRFANIEVVLSPARPKHLHDQGGSVIATEQVGREAAQFDNHQFTTDDKELVKKLRDHRLFGNPVEGYVEDYDVNRPSVYDQGARIQDLAVRGDVAGIRELVEEERSEGDGGRDQVVTLAERALTTLSKPLSDDEDAEPADLETRQAGSNSEFEPIQFASDAAEEKAKELKVKPEALRERKTPSGETGYTVADVEAVARAEGKDDSGGSSG